MPLTHSNLDLLKAVAEDYLRELYAHGGCVNRAAKALGINRTTLLMRVQRLEREGVISPGSVETARALRRYRDAEARRLVAEELESVGLATIGTYVRRDVHSEVARCIAACMEGS